MSRSLEGNELENIQREIRLVEYQKAQDSAEHYNSMIWTLVSVGIGLSLTILYLTQTTNLENSIKLIMLFIGSFILFYFSFLIEKANEIKNYKYDLCKEIEKHKDYKFIGQNLKLAELPLAKLKFKGINIFRTMKFLLYFLYFISILYILIASLNGRDILLYLIPSILGFIGIILALIFEIIIISSSV